MPSVLRTEKLLAEFFNINLVKLEREKRKMLDECRKANEKDAGRKSAKRKPQALSLPKGS